MASVNNLNDVWYNTKEVKRVLFYLKESREQHPIHWASRYDHIISKVNLYMFPTCETLIDCAGISASVILIQHMSSLPCHYILQKFYLLISMTFCECKLFPTNCAIAVRTRLPGRGCGHVLDRDDPFGRLGFSCKLEIF